ncbi:MAG: pyridoxamine 5'-phosphate oxidase family protein [Mycolicibacterium sp.]|uniref:pyridoxamine 5'-phosphate oxidase family protein n=1 Tax=Mycolicibacterium sp. TaxID=2320850 RepID=UPI000FB98A8E|nr:pyridoxamine 5'-phosphate oxidase family protein [Mycolicibacterium sp.]RUP26243.1 MAG: pyridoxamine 5'-phosphate oxidase family protein [Mycolicibacterium sp.]
MANLVYDGGLSWQQPADPRRRRLASDEALRLLASVTYGRVVFTEKALPAIRPVNHLVDDGRIIIRTRLTTALSAAIRACNPPTVVAYEADDLDPQRRTGWSVIVVGSAQTVTDPDEIARYENVLQPWVNHADSVIAIEPQVVTGFRVSAESDPASA